MKTALTLAVLLVAPVVVLAHSGVKDPQVMARMEAMKAIGDATKVLGQMAKGAAPFDAKQAAAAADAIARHAKDTPALFEPRADDPKSEALPVIWESWSDFLDKSDALYQSASQLPPLDDLDAVKSALGRIGPACKACHEVYRRP